MSSIKTVLAWHTGRAKKTAHILLKQILRRRSSAITLCSAWTQMRLPFRMLKILSSRTRPSQTYSTIWCATSLRKVLKLRVPWQSFKLEQRLSFWPPVPICHTYACETRFLSLIATRTVIRRMGVTRTNSQYPNRRRGSESLLHVCPISCSA